MSPLVETVSLIGDLKRSSGRLRKRLYQIAGKTVAVCALSHLADLDESLRQLEALLLFHAEAVLSAEEGDSETKKGDHI